MVALTLNFTEMAQLKTKLSTIFRRYTSFVARSPCIVKLHLFCICVPPATVFFIIILNALYNHTHLHLCVPCLTIVTRVCYMCLKLYVHIILCVYCPSLDVYKPIFLKKF